MSCVSILWDVKVCDAAHFYYVESGVELLFSRQLDNAAVAKAQTASLGKGRGSGPFIALCVQNHIRSKTESSLAKICVVVCCPRAGPTTRDVECNA